MEQNIIEQVAKQLNISIKQVEVVINLLEDGATVPFIARYRKEMTNALDEEQIRLINKEYEYGVSLLKRKKDVIRLIDEKGMLTSDLEKQILEATKLVEVEDLYRPYKEKKKTKATEAIALGLEGLARIMMSFPIKGSKEEISSKFLTDKVESVEVAINHACNIIAEWISDNAYYRKALRNNLNRLGIVSTKIKKSAEDLEGVYKNYYEYSESIKTIKPHRVLAINRAEDEKIINVSIETDADLDIKYLNSRIIKEEKSLFTEDIKKAIIDSYKRLIMPSIQREVRAELSEKAEETAIMNFSRNLHQLLLQAPIKNKVVLGVDPAFRTGCKLAVVDDTGKVLEIGVIYPNEKKQGQAVDDSLLEKSKKTILNFIKKYKIEIIAIGNGTASRETESFISEIIKEYKFDVKYVIVSEAGASVYSASELAQEEFPNLEVQERSAISIARRLQDPLSELVKIEPKAIGVGQYQHDVTQSKLVDSLNDVVSEAVNKVGVDVNTASYSLLNYVSGLNKSIAINIIKYRDEVGKFENRNSLKKVPKLGNKTFEQAIGFLRVFDGNNILDQTSIHPESYEVAKKVMFILGINALGTDEVKEVVSKVERQKLMADLNVDKYTLDDILDAFIAPRRDPRDEYQTPVLRQDVLHLEDLKIGDELEGTVRNVVDFGVFVDCGLKNDGLVHLSKMSTKYIKHPSDMVSIGDLVKVYVIGIDLDRKKLALSMVK